MKNSPIEILQHVREYGLMKGTEMSPKPPEKNPAKSANASSQSTEKPEKTMEASFSMLSMSIASSALMALGLAPSPQGTDMPKDKDMARFNIDLLVMLKEKTNNNLNSDEQKFLEALISDLQMKFVQS